MALDRLEIERIGLRFLGALSAQRQQRQQRLQEISEDEYRRELANTCPEVSRFLEGKT